MASLNPDITVIYKEINGSQISTDIYIPSEIPERLPCLIDIHGGAFMLGASNMVNKDQIRDCLERNWLVVCSNHRLCPRVDLLQGPMADIRDLLAWIYNGTLDKVLRDAGSEVTVDKEKTMAFGTSSGGHLALSLGYDVPRSPAAILDMYGPIAFEDPFWTKPLPGVAAKLPPGLSENWDFLSKVFREHPVPTTAGVSLEGQALPPDFANPRQAFAISAIATGRVANPIYPKSEKEGWRKVDPVLNVTRNFPPTVIVHGTVDTSVPINLSHKLFKRLKEAGIECDMIEIDGEEHTFSAKMIKNSPTWKRQQLGFDFLERVISRKLWESSL
jgi:acetyl esterase/lipase